MQVRDEPHRDVRRMFAGAPAIRRDLRQHGVGPVVQLFGDGLERARVAAEMRG